jgi:hypothetical protein
MSNTFLQQIERNSLLAKQSISVSPRIFSIVLFDFLDGGVEQSTKYIYYVEIFFAKKDRA